MLKKITTLIITLLLVSVVTFVAFSVIPGDPALAKLGTYATPERVEALREEMGLNKSLPERYVDSVSYTHLAYRSPSERRWHRQGHQF